MVKSRMDHSSCSLGDYVYVIGGKDTSTYHDTIERANFGNYLNELCVNFGVWELLQPSQSYFERMSGRMHPLVAPLNDSEILILGGQNSLGFRDDGFVLNIS